MPPDAYNHKGMYYVMICKEVFFVSGIVSIHNRLYTYYDLERDLQELAILLSGFHGIDFRLVKH